MAVQNGETPTATYFPQAHCLVNTAAGEKAPIGTEGHRVDFSSVTVQNGEALTALHLPQAHRSVITATGEGPPIGAESH